jgi:hypothetical protein
MQRTVFLTSLAGGLLLAGTIYFVLFDRLSETMLVQLSALWFLPFVFGFYGLLARLLAKRTEPAKVVAASAPVFVLIIRVIARALPPIVSVGVLVVFALTGLPLLLIKDRRPFRIAVLGVAIWAPVLAIFLLYVFPSL